jgi:hypothetical protein
VQAGVHCHVKRLDSGFPNGVIISETRLWLYRHSGLDPWFDRLTTLSNAEGESSPVSIPSVSGCRIKSGMTGRVYALFLITTQSVSPE